MNVGKLSLDNLEKYGEYTSLHYGGHDFTNLQEANSAATMASVLRDRNVGIDDRVVVMMPNSPGVTRAFQAVWKLGAAIIPVTPQLGAKEVRYMLEDSAASHIITSPLLADRVAEASDGINTVKQMLVLGESAARGAIDISEEVQQAAGSMPLEHLADRSGDDMALLLYTSGTTGQPKGVILSHDNLSSNAISVSGMDPSIGPQERGLHVLPLSHSFGVLVMNLGYIMGSVSALMSHFDLEVVFQQLDKYKIERMAGVPTMLTYMLNFPDRAKYDTSHLREMSTGGAALPNEVRLAFQKEFDCRVMDGYGMSECAPSATGYYGGDEYRPGSVGRAIPDVDVRIHDDKRRTGRTRGLGRNLHEGPERDERIPKQARSYLRSPSERLAAQRRHRLHGRRRLRLYYRSQKGSRDQRR